MKFWVKTFEDGKVLAACDESVLGRCYEEGKRVLDLHTYRSFYEGELVNEETLLRHLHRAKNVNLVGPACVALAENNRLIPPGCSHRIAGIPHVHIYHI